MTSTSNRKASVRSHARAAEDELDLGRHLGLLLEHRNSIAATIVLMLGVGGLYLTAATPIYRANALLQIEKKGSSLGALDQLLADFSGEAPTEMEILGSRALLGRVIEELRLDVQASPRRFPLLGVVFARTHGGTDPAEPPLWGLQRFAWGGEHLLVERMSVPPELEDVPLTLVAGEGGAYTLLGPDSALLLSGRAGEAAEAAPGSPRKVELFVTQLAARPGTQFEVTRRSHLAVVEELQHMLRASEKGTNTGILSVTLEGDDPAGIFATLEAVTRHYVRYNVERRSAEAEKTLVFLETQLPGLRKEVERAEAALSAHRAGKGNVDLGLEAQSLLDRSADVEKSISALSLERSELRQRFTEHHPALVSVSNKLARLRASRTALNAQLKGLPTAELVSAQLMRDVKVANELYLQLNNKAQEYRVLKASTVGNSRILDEPVVSRLPVRPSKSGVMAISLVLGLALGVALAFARQAFRGGVSDPATLEAELGVPIYASVPFSKIQARWTRRTQDSGQGGIAILAETHPRDLVVESLRGLRTRLELSLRHSRNNVIAITGLGPGDGTSFVSLNLAWVLADAGKRVLLVDANLREGWLHRCFVAERSHGLSEILLGTAELEQAVLQTPGQRLSFLPTGTLPLNPAELLLSQAFADLLARMAVEYDVVLIDTPPILAVTDAALVGRRAGVNLVVVRAGVHPMRELAAAVRWLEQNDVPLQGVVLNGVPQSQTGRAASGIYQYEYPTAR